MDELRISTAGWRRKGKPVMQRRPKWFLGETEQSGMDRAFSVMMSTTATIT